MMATLIKQSAKVVLVFASNQQASAGLHSVAGAWFTLEVREVAGSNPVVPTILLALRPCRANRSREYPLRQISGDFGYTSGSFSLPRTP
jgi:hypothetical protein